MAATFRPALCWFMGAKMEEPMFSLILDGKANYGPFTVKQEGGRFVLVDGAGVDIRSFETRQSLEESALEWGVELPAN